MSGARERRVMNYTANQMKTAIALFSITLLTAGPHGAASASLSAADAIESAMRLIRQGHFSEAHVSLRNLPRTSRAETFEALLLEGDLAMREGKPAEAHEIFVQAETQGDQAPEADLGQVRADLLGGEFRRASAFALLTAGEHADSTEALALGAFLEDRAGQTERVLDYLDQMLKSQPDVVPLLAARAEILIDRGRAGDAAAELDKYLHAHGSQPDLVALRARSAAAQGDGAAALQWRSQAADGYANVMARWPAPYFIPFPTAADGRRANGLVIDAGRRVITPVDVVAGNPRALYVRNGLGQLRAATLEKIDATAGLARLLLKEPFEARWSVSVGAAAEPVPGRGATVIGFGMTDPHEATWPIATAGFVVRPRGSALRFSMNLSTTEAGCPVFNPQGNLVGIVAPRLSTDAPTVSDAEVIPAMALRTIVRDAAPVAGEPNTPVSTKELYERTQGAVVVVVASRR